MDDLKKATQKELAINDNLRSLVKQMGISIDNIDSKQNNSKIQIKFTGSDQSSERGDSFFKSVRNSNSRDNLLNLIKSPKPAPDINLYKDFETIKGFEKSSKSTKNTIDYN